MKAVCIHVALCGLVTAVVSGCDQPKPNCLTAQASFVLKLEKTGWSAECPVELVATSPASFYEDPQVGIATYYARDGKGQPDYRKGSIAIRTAELANLVAYAKERGVQPVAANLSSLGSFVTEEPDDDNLCRAPVLGETRVVIPAIAEKPDDPAKDGDDSEPAQRAVDVTLKWSEVDVYVTPASLGTQMRAKLEDTRVLPDGRTCTINYDVRGLAPAVPCYQTNDKGNPITKADGTFEIDATLCNPDPDPSKQRFTGSGISPSTLYECDPQIGYCVLAGPAFPALK